jgi:hypothetical protein
MRFGPPFEINHAEHYYQMCSLVQKKTITLHIWSLGAGRNDGKKSVRVYPDAPVSRIESGAAVVSVI